MPNDSSLGDRIVAGELLIQQLLDEAMLVGGVFTMGYEECLVLTNDLWKKQAGGIPQHCFLLATATVPGTAPDVEDEEIVLLRVVGPAPLPAEAELVQVREQAMREMIVSGGPEVTVEPPEVLDVLTRNEIQFSGLKAKILGTFYDGDVNGLPLLLFGSDVETFYSASRYRVYKPYGRSLARIASFPEITEQEEIARQSGGRPPERVRIGTVRYSSASRRRRLNTGGEKDTVVPVKVNVGDFVAMKTALFGMTRLGKSNAVKTIASAVFKYAADNDSIVGQLIFDPTGEYANVNVQDQTALSQIGNEFVTIFRYGAPDNEPGIRSLSINFYLDETIEVTWQIITSFLLARNTSNYVQSFVNANVIGPEDVAENRSAFNRAQRNRAALYATLMRAGFQVPNNFSVSFAVRRDVMNAVNEEFQAQGREELQTNQRGLLTVGPTELRSFWDVLPDAIAEDDNLRNWSNSELDAIIAVYRGTAGSGYRLLEPLRKYHSSTRDRDFADEILHDLIDGQIVIVDLSRGADDVLQRMSERIVHHVVGNAAQRFADGLEPHCIQIYIEEAHRLFNRDRMNVRESADPYVRLAKEAAKFEIGLVYATQEVTSVDPIILSNTSNWIVTHLNNQEEVKALAKYYDFKDFSELTLKAEDVGFARLKTRSGRYIVPVQIDLFSASNIEAAREAGIRRVGINGTETTG